MRIKMADLITKLKELKKEYTQLSNKAQKEGDKNMYGYYLGVVLGLTLAIGKIKKEGESDE